MKPRRQAISSMQPIFQPCRSSTTRTNSAACIIEVWLPVSSQAVPRGRTSRPDVGAVFPAQGAAHGIDTTIPLAAGRNTVCAFGINVLGAHDNPLLSCSEVTVAAGQSLPFGMLDSVSVANGITTATGWAVEPDAPTKPVETHFYVDGRF